MLTEDDDAWTIQVIYPEGTSAVPPLLCESDTLVSLETSEFSKDEAADDKEKPKADIKNQRIKYQRRVTTKECYKCPNCEKVYNARRNLTRHINSECGKQPRFACPYCEYRNYRRNEIKKHVNSKHNISWDNSDVLDVFKQVCS